MARTNSTIECATTAIERQVQRPTASAHGQSPSGNPRLSAFCRSAPTDVGHRLFRRRAGSGHARRQPGSPAPAGNAGGAVDVLEARPGECAEFIADRKADVERLFTHRWRLEQAEEAYRLFDTQTTGKAVIL